MNVRVRREVGDIDIELPRISDDGPHPLISGEIDPSGCLPALSASFRFIVLPHYIHLRGCNLPLHFLRILLERSASEGTDRGGKEGL